MGTPVSGPGKFSERTDKAVENANQALPNAGYGEQKAYQEQQGGAAMSQSAPDFSSFFGSAAERVIPMDAPTQQAGVPVTAGAAAGAGPGMEALGLADEQAEDLKSLVPYLPVLEFMANQPGASWAMRNIVRKAKASG